MASHEHSHHDSVPFDTSKIGAPAGLLGGILLVVSLAVMSVPDLRTQMLQSYLFGWVFWMTMVCGCFGLTLLHHTVRGTWGLPIMRMLESGGSARAFLFMGLFFAPVIAFMPTLYSWANPEVVAADKILQWKQPYLNPQAFVIRAVVFIGIMALMAWGFRRSTKRQDASGDVNEQHLRTNHAAPGILLFGLIMTFAFTDWVMSLDAHWFSTIWGVLFLVGSCMGALSFCVMLLMANAEKAPWPTVMSSNLTKDLGNLMFVFTMLWGYTHVSQFLIIWSGNLPEFTSYFKNRSDGGWNAVGCALIVGQFFLPFVALLVPRAKRAPMTLAKIAGWLFVIRIVDIYNFVMPFFRSTPMPAWTDIVAFLGFGGLWLAVFAREMKGVALLPKYDTRLQEALEHAH